MDCRQFCQNTAGCVYWTYRTSDTSCHAKGNTHTVSNPGHISAHVDCQIPTDYGMTIQKFQKMVYNIRSCKICEILRIRYVHIFYIFMFCLSNFYTVYMYMIVLVPPTFITDGPFGTNGHTSFDDRKHGSHFNGYITEIELRYGTVIDGFRAK